VSTGRSAHPLKYIPDMNIIKPQFVVEKALRAGAGCDNYD